MNRLGQLVTLDHSSSMLQVMKYDRGQATIMPKVADHSGVNKETRISYSVLLQAFGNRYNGISQRQPRAKLLGFIHPMSKAHCFQGVFSKALAKEKTTYSTKPKKPGVSVIKSTSCPLSHEPNEETKKVLREASAGVGLTRCNNMDEFRRRLLED